MDISRRIYFLVIAGIHLAKSLENRERIVEWYSRRIFLGKLSRYLVPYIIIQIIFVILFSIDRNFYDIESYAKWFLTGGAGPGGYYTMCTLQFLCVFPVVYYLVKRTPIMGIILILTINIVWELLSKHQIIPYSLNRLCCIRMLCGLLIGTVFYLYWDDIKGTIIPEVLFVVGALFLIHSQFLDINLYLLQLFRHRHSHLFLLWQG